MLTGDNSRAIRPYGAELPGQGRVGTIFCRDDVIKALPRRQRSFEATIG